MRKLYYLKSLYDLTTICLAAHLTSDAAFNHAAGLGFSITENKTFQKNQFEFKLIDEVEYNKIFA